MDKSKSYDIILQYADQSPLFPQRRKGPSPDGSIEQNDAEGSMERNRETRDRDYRDRAPREDRENRERPAREERDARNKDRTPPRDRSARSARNKRKRRRKGGVFKVILTIVLVLVLTGAILACLTAMYIKNVILPETDLQLDAYNEAVQQTSKMYYRDLESGNYVEMQELYGDENRVWVPLEEIPENLRNAAVAIEDQRFYKHHGVDWKRTVKGVMNMFTGQDIVGGSTITQQLIKNMTGEDEVTVKRKITEIFKALELEKNYSKDKILESYLNYIYLGQGCNGVYTAAYRYFGKHVSELSLAECASLIGITNNPSKYDPLGHLEVVNEETGEVKTSRDFNKERQETILYKMAELGYITEEERDAAIAEPLDFSKGEEISTQSKVYTWYEDAVIEQVLADLQSEFNWSKERARTALFSGGLQIYTCLNPDIQAAVDAVYSDRNNLNYTSANGQPMQSAITVVDNKTGYVVALSGGIGEKTGSRNWNRATNTKRPPGSSIKPLAVYAPAIELGYITPNSTEVDSPYDKIDGRDWPVNASGKYQGTVSINKAVRESINTVAVKVLANYVTPQVSYEFMRDKFHIKLVESMTQGDKNYTDIGLAQLALGGLTEGVSTYEMAAAYSVFPRNGIYKEPLLYTTILDSNGDLLLDKSGSLEPEQALSQRTAYYMTEMLEGVVVGAGGTGHAANFVGQDIAGKTGTTTSRKDLWFVGYTPYYTAAVWTGYDQQERLASGLQNPSTRLWNLVMSKVHVSIPYKEFPKPDAGTMQTVKYCTVSGKLPSAYCGSHVAVGSFFPEDVPTTYCTIHKMPVVKPSTPSSGGGGGGSSSSGGASSTGGDTEPAAEAPAAEAPAAEAPAAEAAGE